MRYVTDLSRCRASETKVSVYPGPEYLCVSAIAVTLGSVSGVCGAGTKVKVPGGPPSFYCAKALTGQLRGRSGLDCRAGEIALAIGPDTPPSVTGTSPADGATNVPLSSAVSVTFSESVQATTSSFGLECPAGTPKTFTLSSAPASTFTLTPTSNLPVNTTCAVTVVAKQIVDADGDLHMVSDDSFSFKTVAAPQVTSTTPANGATGVATQSTITISFSQSVKATGTAFKLECPAGIPKSFSQSATPASSVTLTPTSPMPVSTACKVTVVALQVTDASSGTPMLADYVFSFTIDTAPTVTSTSPATGATIVATTATVTVNFSEQVAASTSSFKLECPTGTPVAYSLSSSLASSFTLTPTSGLPQATVCTVTVVASQVHDTDASTPLQADYVFSFTVDTVATVTSTTPPDGGTVGPGSTVTINFSESVNTTSGAFKLECPSGSPVSFTVTLASPASSYVLHPSSSLPLGTTCAVTVVAAQVHDVDSGSPMAADYSFSFSIGSPPAVTGTTPSNGDTGISPSTTITVNFNKQVNATTSSFKIECPTGTPESFGLSSSPASTFTLTPSSKLPSGTDCTVTVVASQVTSTDFGLNMAADFVFDFATAPAPKVTSTSPADGATNVATNATITVNFNRSANASASSFGVECPTGSPVAYSLSSSPSTSFTLTPNGPLPGGTTCTVTVIAAQVTDAVNGTPMDADYVFSFGTDIPPTVTTTTPTGGATGVATTASVTVNFSEPVNASTSSFSLECPTGTPISYTPSASPASSFTLIPTTNLPSGAVCTVTVHADQVSDVDEGSPMPADYVFSFTVDTVATVTGTTPPDGGTVGPGSTVTITFSESVATNGSSFKLECPSGTPVSFTVTPASPAGTYVLHPSSSLPIGTTCAVTVVAAQVHDVDSGSPMAADYSFSFDVAAPPAVSSTTPTDGATDVAPTTTVGVTFSKQVNATTSSFKIECPTGTPESYSLSSSPATTFTLTPSSHLPSGTTCTVTVVASQVTSTDFGVNMAADYVFSFKTATAPKVTSTTPADGATNVATKATITVDFDRSVNASTSSFKLECPTGTSEGYSLSSSPSTSFTLTLTASLPGGVTCTVTVVASQVADASTGTPMDADYVFSFTTDVPPTVSSTIPTDGATSVNTGSTIKVTFSEAVNTPSGSFSLECPTGTPEAFSVSGSPGTTITLTPSSNLPAGTVCTVTVHADHVNDVDTGSPMPADYVFSFTTDLPPTVTSTVPTNGATSVNAGSKITINFSEQVNVSGSAFKLECPTGTPEAFTTNSSPASSFTLTPSANLPAGTVCTVTVDHTQVTDTDAGTGMTSDYVFSFTVDVPPSVTSTNPTNSAINVPLASTITVTFSESVNATTSSFKLECPTGTPKSFSLSSSPATTFTLTPSANLPIDTICTVTVLASQIADVDAGSHLTADFVFSFHTVIPPPVAVNDSYAATGNVGINVTPQVNGVLNNDTLNTATLNKYGATNSPATPVDGSTTVTTTNGGTVLLQTNGTFTYNPPPGYLGDDHFFYNLHNNGGDSVGDVKITISNMIWFFDASNASAGDGRLSNPFKAISSFANDGATNHGKDGQTLFISTGTYTDPLALRNSQILIGKAATASITTTSGITLAPFSNPLPTTGGTAPSLTTASGNAITLGSGNTIRGLDIGNKAASGIAGTNFGTLTLSEVNITGAGRALNLDTGTANATFGTLSSSSGTNGVKLNAISGSPSAAGGTLTGASGNELDISAGAGDFTYPGAITNTGTNKAVNIAGKTGGTIALAGPVSDTGGSGAGVLLSGNTGATISFTGGVQFSTGASNAFTATGGGTVNVTTAATRTLTTTSGTALSLNGVGGTIGFTDLDKNGAGTGINLTNVSAAVTVGTGASIASTTTAGVHIDQGTGAFSYAGTISNSSGRTVEVTNRNSGTPGLVQFTGAVSATGGTGVNLDNNDNGTINFSGSLTLSTGANTAFSATNGATGINVAGSGNTLTTTTGTALNVANTTIGASGLTFQSISANGGANGIVLNNTGASGGLTVAGNGSAGTGGTIQDTSGDGVQLTTTEKVSLSYMNITSNLGDGIGGSGINGFVLDHDSITSNGNDAATDESGINLAEVIGTASAGPRPTSITNSTISNNWEFEIQITNTAGTLTDFQMSGNSISADGTQPNHGDLVNFLGHASASMKLTVTSGTFTGNIDTSGGKIITGAAISAVNQGTSHTVNVSGATFINNNVGVDVSSDPINTTLTFNISNNNFQGSRAVAINSFQNGNPPFTRSVTGTISGNTIGTTGVANSGSALGNGISISNEGAISSLNLTITNNQIHQVTNFPGISVNVGLGGATTGGGSTNLTLTGNSFDNIGSRALTIQDNQDQTLAPFPTICADISGNTFGANILGQAGNGQYMRLRELSGNVKVVQASPTAAASPSELDDANGFNDPSKINISGGVAFSQTCP